MAVSLKLKFELAFSEGCEIWTGEDGTFLAIAITRRPDWAEVLSKHHVFRDEPFDPARGKERFAYRDRPEDPEAFSGQRKVWFIGDEPTEFPVIEYELQIPR